VGLPSHLPKRVRRQERWCSSLTPSSPFPTTPSSDSAFLSFAVCPRICSFPSPAGLSHQRLGHARARVEKELGPKECRGCSKVQGYLRSTSPAQRHLVHRDRSPLGNPINRTESPLYPDRLAIENESAHSLLSHSRGQLSPAGMQACKPALALALHRFGHWPPCHVRTDGCGLTPSAGAGARSSVPFRLPPLIPYILDSASQLLATPLDPPFNILHHPSNPRISTSIEISPLDKHQTGLSRTSTSPASNRIHRATVPI
jgi:hypothetical protein